MPGGSDCWRSSRPIAVLYRSTGNSRLVTGQKFDFMNSLASAIMISGCSDRSHLQYMHFDRLGQRGKEHGWKNTQSDYLAGLFRQDESFTDGAAGYTHTSRSRRRCSH